MEHPRARELGDDLIQAGACAAAARGVQRALHLRARAPAASASHALPVCLTGPWHFCELGKHAWMI